jgi:hypothetical protein
MNVWKGWKIDLDPDARPVFPPNVMIEVKALACELPFDRGIPLSRFSTAEIAAEVIRRGIVAQISGSTIWRWLSEDAIRPWQYRSWIFPRDPQFEQKAGRVLDLYQGIWCGNPLLTDEYVISADEKTSIQARVRKHATRAPMAGTCMRVENEYTRGGSLAYIAAWDVKRAKVFGRCESRSGIVPFDRLVNDVMIQEPYLSAKRVFAVNLALLDCSRDGPILLLYIYRYMLVGSIKSRYIFLSFNERFLLQMILFVWKRLKKDFCNFRSTMKKSLNHLNGSLHAKICQRC